MTYRPSFANGRHVAAARHMAGLKQTELAALAGLHVNSIKRLEKAKRLLPSDVAAGAAGQALRQRGIIATTFPMPLVRLADRSDEG